MSGLALVAQGLRSQSCVMIVRKRSTYKEIVPIGSPGPGMKGHVEP
jgi:hypothetical protein